MPRSSTRTNRAELLPVQADQLASAQCRRPTQRQQRSIAGSRCALLVETFDQVAQVISQQRLGLAHGFLPRPGIADALPHARDRRVLAIERVAGVTRLI
jgi:hypothetical protein